MDRLAQRRLLVAVIVAVLAFAAGIAWLVRSEGAYYRQVGELGVGELDGKSVKVGGRVVPHSVTAEGSLHTFAIADLTGTGQTVTVRYAGVLPDTFGPGADVVVVGTWDAGERLIDAAELQTKCPSKYEASRSPAPSAAATQ